MNERKSLLQPGSDPIYESTRSSSCSLEQVDEIRRQLCEPLHASRMQTIDRDAVHFGVRMSVCITISALFVLAQSPERSYPQGMWVLITVLFVCWFPSLDAASVVEKSIQRLIGTGIGAALALACGFLSLLVLGDGNNYRFQSIFLACCIAVFTFLICWSAVQFKVDGTKLIARYNYACILCLLTFTICLVPFYLHDGGWPKAMYRVLNVIIGCIIGAVLSVFVLPRSTVRILEQKMENQIKLAGEASQAVLYTASDFFSENTHAVPNATLKRPPQKEWLRRMSSTRRPWRSESDENVIDYGGELVLEKYESAIKEWRATKSQLSMLQYDPFHFGTPDELLENFRTETTNTLSRVLRIQNTVVLLDGIVRNDPKHDFSESHLALFAEIGTLIHEMLSIPLDLKNHDAAHELTTSKLAQVRGFIIELSSVVATSSREMPERCVGMLGVGILGSRLDLTGMANENGSLDDSMHQDDNEGRGAPKFVHGSRVCALLFLQLVEHLTLRSVRLYHSWKNCDALSTRLGTTPLV